MAFAPATSLMGLSSISSAIEERLSKAIGLLLPKADAFWLNNFQNKQGTIPLDQIGRDWEYIQTWYGSLTGVIEPGKPRGDFPLYGDTHTQIGRRMATQSLNQVFPDPSKGANMTPYQLGVPIRTMLGNIMFTLGEHVHDANKASLAKRVAPKLTGYARHWTHVLSMYLYLSQNDQYRYFAIGASPSAVTSSGDVHRFTFNPDNEATKRVQTGMMVDFYDSTGTTRQNESGGTRIECFVEYIDPMTNTVAITWNRSGGAGWTDPVEGDICVLANSRDSSSPNFTGIAGLNSYIKSGDTASDNTRYILGAERNTSRQIDVSLHPDDFKSFTRDMGGEPLTESILIQILSTFHDHYEEKGHTISQLLGSRGVIHRYILERQGMARLTRGEYTNVKGEGFGRGFSITDDMGNTATLFTSNKVEDGVVYGVQGNWKRLLPGDIPGLKQMSQTDGFVPVKFVAPQLTGTESVVMPMYDTSGDHAQVTEGYQMPCWLRMNLVPDHPAGIKLTNVATSKVFSDF